MIGDALAALADALVQAGIPWYLFGAQAAVLYGVPRLTADVDVTANVALDQVEGLARLLDEAGFAPRVRDVVAFVRRTRVLPLTHRPTGIPVDLVLAGPGLEEEFLERVRFLDLDGVRVPVIAPDDLIVAKVLAGRAKDLEDVRALLREQLPNLDVARIRRLLRTLESALDRGDLIPLFEGAFSEGPTPG